MSAKNRSKQDPNPTQFFETPPWLTQSILKHVIPTEFSGCTPYRILEPCVGKGAILDVLKQYNYGYPVEFYAYDINPQGVGEQADFLTHDFGRRFDLILFNPPFSLALEFAQKALKLRKDVTSKVVMLQRVNWLGSLERAEWLRQNTPSIYVTPKRPKFKLNKKGKPASDATEYCWYAFHEPFPRVTILETDKVEQVPEIKQKHEIKESRISLPVVT